MKKYILTLILLALLILPMGSAQSCLASSDDYAVEVVIEDYDLSNLRKITESERGVFYSQSQYDPNIISIIEETTPPSGLSVKLQVPTELTEINKPYLKFTSTIPNEGMKEIKSNSFGEWQIQCIQNTCEFSSDDKKVTIINFGSELDVTVEITQSLAICSIECSGVCIFTPEDEHCINSKTKAEFNTLFRFFGITENFENLLDSYRIVGSDEIVLIDVVPSYNPYINWQEAIRQELVYLDSKQAIFLTRDDIEAITALAKRGQAGQNYRIVSSNSTWNYYDRTDSPILTSQIECLEYEKIEEKDTLPITGNIAGITRNPFYLVPLILLLGGIFAFIILIIIAKAINARRTYSDSSNTI